jgi:hypothetical protein
MPVGLHIGSFPTGYGIVTHTAWRKGPVRIFRTHPQITSCALSSGGDAAHLPARPHGREEAPTCGGDRRSRALDSPGEGCRVSDVDWGRQPRRGPLFRRAPLFQLPQRGAPASRSRRLGAVVEHGVRGVAPARSDVAIAGRRDVGQRSGRRPALLRPCSPTFTCTSSTRWISTGLSRSGGPAPLP